MSKHFCQAEIIKGGQHFWGSPSERPLADPIPPELMERHPDTLTDWMNCNGCGRAICGRRAAFAIRLNGDDVEQGYDEEIVHLCADHYDECIASRFANWHTCSETIRQDF